MQKQKVGILSRENLTITRYFLDSTLLHLVFVFCIYPLLRGGWLLLSWLSYDDDDDTILCRQQEITEEDRGLKLLLRTGRRTELREERTKTKTVYSREQWRPELDTG